jgi:hypothetical protein
VAHACDQLAQAVEDVGWEHHARPRGEPVDPACELAEPRVAGLPDVGLDRGGCVIGDAIAAPCCFHRAPDHAWADLVARGERIDVGDSEVGFGERTRPHGAALGLGQHRKSHGDVAGSERNGLVHRRDHDDRTGMESQRLGGDLARRMLVERDLGEMDDARDEPDQLRAAQRALERGDEQVGGARQRDGVDDRDVATRPGSERARQCATPAAHPPTHDDSRGAGRHSAA